MIVFDGKMLRVKAGKRHVIEMDVVLTPELVNHYSSGIEKLNGNLFEGVVVKHSNGTFKIINKHYDSKK